MKPLPRSLVNPPPYTLVIIIAILLGVLLVGIVLWLRPSYDPLLVMTGAGALVTTICSTVMTYMKSQETHDIVNGMTHEWQTAQSELARSQGEAQGVANEQARVLPVVAKTEKTD